jgi:hypothetical protein
VLLLLLLLQAFEYADFNAFDRERYPKVGGGGGREGRRKAEALPQGGVWCGGRKRANM